MVDGLDNRLQLNPNLPSNQRHQNLKPTEQNGNK